ncbi:MAG: TonB-dependent receptor plug domain-containing protein [Verrucomicrobia bacterium]|nr:TonB-dependent receptor plug domain-containing protein [Verrucomicrobiota bacterium]
MKRPHPIALLIGWLALTWLPLSAAPTSAGNPLQESGSVFGRVQNVVTGKYLNKARVSVKGTNLQTYTDEFGMYRLVGLRSGPIVLEVFYTDLDPMEVALEVADGRSLERNVELTSKARYGQDMNVVNLDPFVVSSNKETDTEAIATNEQRFAPNIKNVVATDAMGDVLGSSAGDFLKYVPGLTAEYDNADVTAISVRGMGGAMTTFQTDGATVVSGGIGSSRVVEMRTLALNNITRIEVTKVPTPSTPADSLGGAINMISKNAFERKGRELRFGLSVVGNAPENVMLKKTPHPNGDKYTRKLLPGFDFDYTMPVGRNFGVVVTGMQSGKFFEQHISNQTWNAAGTATGASLQRPFLQQFVVQDSPRSEMRTIFSAKTDWRVTPKSVLSLGGRWSRYRGFIGTLSVTPVAGTVGTPTVATGVPFSHGPDFTIGATGRGGVNLVGGSQYFSEDSFGTNLNYRFDDGTWRIDAAVNYSGSKRTRLLRPRRRWSRRRRFAGRTPNTSRKRFPRSTFKGRCACSRIA